MTNDKDENVSYSLYFEWRRLRRECVLLILSLHRTKRCYITKMYSRYQFRKYSGAVVDVAYVLVCVGVKTVFVFSVLQKIEH
jgi:hypothetical protein